MDVAWVKVATCAELPSDRPFGANVDGTEIVLVPSASGRKAFEGRCPHAGTLLAEGEVSNGELVCRAHGWRFACDSGVRKDGESAPLEQFACEERDGAVWVQLGHPRKVAPVAATRPYTALPGPRPLPIVGNALQITLAHLHEQLEAWARAFGPMYRLRVGSSRVVVVSDAQLNEQILRARPGDFRRMSSISDVLIELGIGGVFAAEGPRWRPQRRLVMEALALRHFSAFYPTLQRVLERLLQRFKRSVGQRVAIQEDLTRFTVDVTTSLAFGTDMNTVERDDEVIQRQLEHIFPAITRRAFAPVKYWRVVRLPADRRLDRAMIALRSTFDGLMKQAHARLASVPEDARVAQNFLEAMILSRDEEGRTFDDETVFGNVLTMLLAGEDTTAQSIAFAVHELCERPEVVAKMRAEVDAALGDAMVPRSLEEATNLPYVDAVVQETLRLHHVAPFLGMQANRDVTIGDVAIPADTTVYALLRQPVLQDAHFPDAATFRPERWLDARAPQAFIPFGSGPRICPGRSLALLEMRMVLAALVRNFSFCRVGAKKDVHEVFNFTVFPQNLAVRLSVR